MRHHGLQTRYWRPFIGNHPIVCSVPYRKSARLHESAAQLASAKNGWPIDRNAGPRHIGASARWCPPTSVGDRDEPRHTEREQLTRDLARTHHDLETILNAVPASITSWDRDLTNRFANSAACSRWRALGARKAGRSMSEAMGEHRFEQVRPLLKQVLDGKICTGEQIEEQADGVHNWRSEYLPEMENGDRSAYISFLSISPRFAGHMSRFVNWHSAWKQSGKRSGGPSPQYSMMALRKICFP